MDKAEVLTALEILSKINKNEKVWVTRTDENQNIKYVITGKPDRTVYYLYRIDEHNNVKKIGKARSPTELEKIFI